MRSSDDGWKSANKPPASRRLGRDRRCCWCGAAAKNGSKEGRRRAGEEEMQLMMVKEHRRQQPREKGSSRGEVVRGLRTEDDVVRRAAFVFAGWIESGTGT
jgi:hypothetical protein